MTDRELNRFSMYESVDDYVLQTLSVTKTIHMFTETHSAFHDCILQVRAKRVVQEVDKTGITARKNEMRADIIKKVLDILRKIEAFAVVGGNVQLEKEVHYNESQMKDTPDSILYDICMVIHEKAKENLEGLNSFGITEAVISDFKNNITNFGETIPKPRAGRVTNKGATSDLKEIFSKADKLLIKMDALVEVVRMTEPEFYKNYKNSRIVVETGKGYLALKASAVESGTKEPVKGVQFHFENTDPVLKAAGGNGTIVKKTHKKGKFYIKSIEKGVWNVIVTKVGYKKQVLTVNVPDGEMAELVVEMEKL
jgi:hypothetical protein